METFFRHYWNSKYSFVSGSHLYKSFKKFHKDGKIPDAKLFLLEVKQSSEIYRKIGKPSEKDWTIQKQRSIKKSIELLNQYQVTIVRPFLLSLLECRNQKNLNETRLINTITNLENFHLIFSRLCQERASGLANKYSSSARALHRAGNDANKIAKIIDDLNDYLRSKRPSLQKIEDSLTKVNYRDKDDKRLSQIIFEKIEHFLRSTGELNVAVFSLEHIKDQSAGASWINKIGNLLPLDESINNKIPSQLLFSDKKRRYQESEFKTVDKFLKLFNEDDEWTEPTSEKWMNEVSKLLEEATRIK
ncbi:HNH endonuclease family protein [Baaleninema simplex]|uniref:HNH endonuclease family protein n=1 Tax=Baaleninema simplex TaxID=2862350 RepID=UPI0003459A4D|nr:HNH endonuclease family protein [Baaleninema simplex]